MKQTVSVPADEMGHLIAPLLSEGKRCRFICGGNSMYPLIRDGDTLTVAPLTGKPVYPGDVLAFLHPFSSCLVIHRVMAVGKGNTVFKGDHVRETDTRIPGKYVLGILESVTRNGRPVWAGLGPERKWIALFSRMNLILRFSSAFLSIRRRIRLFCR